MSCLTSTRASSGEGDGVLPFGSTLAAGAVGDASVYVAKNLRGFDLGDAGADAPFGRDIGVGKEIAITRPSYLEAPSFQEI